MESLAPPLELLLVVKREMEKGLSVKSGLVRYLKCSKADFSAVVHRWFVHFEQGLDTNLVLGGIESAYRIVLLQILERGLRGESILQTLGRLEEEIIAACDDEIAQNIAKLPFMLLVPLLLFQFPAFLMLLFGPLLQNFFHSLGGG
jgi:hypothetical protein